MTARYLGPAGKGAYSLIVLIPTLFVVFGSLSVDSAYVYLIGKKRYSLSEITSNAVILTIIVSSILIMVYMLTFQFIHVFLRNISYLVIFIAILSVPFKLFLLYSQGIFLGADKITKLNLSMLIEYIFLLVSIIISLVVLRKGLELTIFTYTISYVALFIIVFYWLNRLTPINLAFRSKLIKESLKIGIKTHFNMLFYYFNTSLGLLLAGIFLPLHEVGYYAVALNIIVLGYYILSPLSYLLFAKTCSFNIEESNKLTSRVCRITIVAIAVLAIIIFIMSKWLIYLLYGKTYAPSLLLLRIMLLSLIPYSILRILMEAMKGRGHFVMASVISFITMLMHILLNLYLIPKTGTQGAAFSFTISHYLASILVLIFFLKISGSRLSDILFIKMSDLAYIKNLIIKKVEM